MNCSDCEKLFDAYLDGQLAGSLRLEFDAHRLRCQRCQQTLAMLETIGHVIASDPQLPDLSVSFTDRVMGQIERPRRVSRRPWRVAVVVGAVLQAAAVLVFAIMLNRPSNDAAPPAVVAVHDGSAVGGQPDPGEQAILDLIADRVEDRVWEMHAAGTNLTTDLIGVARYFDITLPADLASGSEQVAGINPLQGIMDALVPGEAEEAEPAAPADEIYSI